MMPPPMMPGMMPGAMPPGSFGTIPPGSFGTIPPGSFGTIPPGSFGSLREPSGVKPAEDFFKNFRKLPTGMLPPGASFHHPGYMAASMMHHDHQQLSNAVAGPSLPAHPSDKELDVNPVALSSNPFLTQKQLPGPGSPMSAQYSHAMQSQSGLSFSGANGDPLGRNTAFSRGDDVHKVDWAHWAGTDVTGKMNELIRTNGFENPTAGKSLMQTFGTNARGKIQHLRVSKGIKSLMFEENPRLGHVFNLTPLFANDEWKQKVSPQMEALDAADNEMDPVDAWILGYDADGSQRIEKWNQNPDYVGVAPDGTVVDRDRVIAAKQGAAAPELAPDKESLYERWYDAAAVEHTTHQQALAMRYFRELCALVETARANPNNPQAADIMWTNDPKVFPLPKELRAEGKGGLPPWEQGIMPFSPEQRQYFPPQHIKPDTYSIDVYVCDFDNLFPGITPMASPRNGKRSRSPSPARTGNYPGHGIYGRNAFGGSPGRLQGLMKGFEGPPGMKYKVMVSTEAGESLIMESDLMNPAVHNGFHDWGRLDEYKMPLDYQLPDALFHNKHPRQSLEGLAHADKDMFGLTISIIDEFGNLYAQGLAPPHMYYSWRDLKFYKQAYMMNVRKCSRWMRVPMRMVNGPKPSKNQPPTDAYIWVHTRIYAGKEAKPVQPGPCGDMCGARDKNQDNEEDPEEGRHPPEPWDLRVPTKGDDSNIFGPTPGHPTQLPDPDHTWRKEKRDHPDIGKAWNKVSVENQNWWTVLGWSQLSWQSENPSHYPASESKPWNGLAQREKDAATGLRFSESSWDAHMQPGQIRGFSKIPKSKPLTYEESEPWARLTEFGHSSSELGFAVVFNTYDKEKSNCGAVNKGEFDNMYFVEALNAISCRPKLAQQLFYAWDVGKGIYSLRIMCNGTWVRVEIDDYVPPRLEEVGEGKDSKPACCYSEQFPYVLWPSLVEKAYAKIHTARPPYGNSGGWQAIAGGGRVEEALADLTGGVAGRFSTSDASFDRLFVYLYHLQRHCLWVVRPHKSNCMKHGVILNEGDGVYVVNRAAPYMGETYVQLFGAGTNLHIDGAGLQTYSVPLEVHDMFPEKSGSGYFWIHMLDFSMYFDAIFECRLTNSPDVGLINMPDFPHKMHLHVPQPLDSKSLGPNLFKETVVANKGLLTPDNPPEFDIFVPGAACPCEITCCLQQAETRTTQMGNVRAQPEALLLKVYQQTGQGGDNYSSELVCKSNWLPTRDAMISFSAKQGGRFLVTCGFPTEISMAHSMCFRVYSSCDGVVTTARTSYKSHKVVAAGSENEARAIKWTFVGCRSAHRSDDSQPEPYDATSDGILLPVMDQDKQQCTVM